MTASLLAWIETRGGNAFLAAYNGACAHNREPATRLCGTTDEARSWLESEAKALGLPITWVEQRSGA
ncbi:MAG: hypothetical protein WDN25_01730 [Acetobacteraceae bacterium]